MTIEMQTMVCPCCRRGKMVAQLDKSVTLWLACQDQKCGALLRHDAAVTMIAETDARRSNAIAPLTGSRPAPAMPARLN